MTSAKSSRKNIKASTIFYAITVLLIVIFLAVPYTSNIGTTGAGISAYGSVPSGIQKDPWEPQTINDPSFLQEGGNQDGSGSQPLLSYCNVSRMLGYMSAAAMILLFVSGCRTPKVKKCINRLCGCPKNRLKLHCWTSYFALFTALIHGLIFMWRKETLYLDDLPVLLGDISVIAMALVALNGIFQKRIIRSYGFKKWYLFHIGGSVLALTTAAIHVLRLNTIV